jgi:hypothetical protein
MSFLARTTVLPGVLDMKSVCMIFGWLLLVNIFSHKGGLAVTFFVLYENKSIVWINRYLSGLGIYGIAIGL